jgi:hypothetical protein
MDLETNSTTAEKGRNQLSSPPTEKRTPLTGLVNEIIKMSPVNVGPHMNPNNQR